VETSKHGTNFVNVLLASLSREYALLEVEYKKKQESLVRELVELAGFSSLFGV
jgi:hypothetical protein